MASKVLAGRSGAAEAESLLRFGTFAGPFYLTAGVLQGLAREGFDFGRHPLSVLANGSGGWLQTVNFVLTGLMVIAAAVGVGRALGPGTNALRGFLAAFGTSMLAAALFPADPVDGFPPGTPLGPPTSITTPGLLHFVFGALGFLSLAISCFIASRVTSRRNQRTLARLSLLSGIVIVLGFFGGFALPVGTLGIWIAVLVGWVWLAALSLAASRATRITP